MAGSKVLVTRRLPQKAIDLLKSQCEVEVNEYERPLTKMELIEKIADKDGLLCLLNDKIDGEVMAAAQRLKVIANYAVGFDNIDVATATKMGIAVTNTPGILSETTADMAWALILTVARRIVEADRFLRAGKFTGWAPMMFLGSDVHGKTLGIVGFGRIGRAMASRAKGFNMTILYSNPGRAEVEVEKKLCAKFVPLDVLLRQSDFVTLHVPLTPRTMHLIGEKEISLMKPTAYLINTSRGAVVDEKALVKALRNNKIAGAGLDVFEDEPRLTTGLEDLENIVIVPHIASATVETRTNMALAAAENLMAALRGEVPPNIVNSQIYRNR